MDLPSVFLPAVFRAGSLLPMFSFFCLKRSAPRILPREIRLMRSEAYVTGARLVGMLLKLTRRLCGVLALLSPHGAASPGRRSLGVGGFFSAFLPQKIRVSLMDNH